MKKRNLLFVILSVFFIMVSCKEKEIVNNDANHKISGEDCEVSISGVRFTKSINNAVNLISSVNVDSVDFRSEGGKDFFSDPDGKLSNNTAPILLAKVDNTKSFTFISKVTPAFKEMYDAGTLYIYVNDGFWQKFAFERDERGKNRMVTVRTIDYSDDNNHDVIIQESVYMKISSDTQTVGFYFSLDKVNWQLARLYKNNYPSEIWVGIGAQSPMGDGMTTRFTDCALSFESIKDFRFGE